ncbi:hypothetical protein OOK41_01400 [Micromonospora sp. NBC_01655]|uniref:hypothetical protein n=1 Tax=Micromonospora sp. NBC_01655 TaxID=2975983 RepID=UPI00225863B1|nr:hypothetical protein [Micromonospora sp. NBC_01655]MCX4468980.1 hypothetical protein [Micromonospora sp. NBC_01655]
MVAIWSELRAIVRWLAHRDPLPPPDPRPARAWDDADQGAARQRILDQAQRLRATPWHCEPTVILPAVLEAGPRTLGQRTGYGTTNVLAGLDPAEVLAVARLIVSGHDDRACQWCTPEGCTHLDWGRALVNLAVHEPHQYRALVASWR